MVYIVQATFTDARFSYLMFLVETCFLLMLLLDPIFPFCL